MAEIKRVKLRDAGMFSNVVEVVEHVRRAERGGYRFFIDWSESCYHDGQTPGDPWDWYFQPVFAGITPEPGVKYETLPRGKRIVCLVDNVITPRLRDKDCAPLLPPTDRHAARDIITRHIRLSSQAQKRVDQACAQLPEGPFIGVHIRGPGKNDDGVAQLNAHLTGDPDAIPYDTYFAAVERATKALGPIPILVCSDSDVVMRRMRDRFGDRVFHNTVQRSEFGEPHRNIKANRHLCFDPVELGFEILIEAYTLARSAWLVHGSSNVTNFVLGYQPDLPASYVFADVPHTTKDGDISVTPPFTC